MLQDRVRLLMRSGMQQGNFVIKEDSDKDEQFAENFENDDEGVMSYT